MTVIRKHKDAIYQVQFTVMVMLWTCPKSLSDMYILIRAIALHILGIRMWKNSKKISNSVASKITDTGSKELHIYPLCIRL